MAADPGKVSKEFLEDEIGTGLILSTADEKPTELSTEWKSRAVKPETVAIQQTSEALTGPKISVSPLRNDLLHVEDGAMPMAVEPSRENIQKTTGVSDSVAQGSLISNDEKPSSTEPTQAVSSAFARIEVPINAAGVTVDLSSTMSPYPINMNDIQEGEEKFCSGESSCSKDLGASKMQNIMVDSQKVGILPTNEVLIKEEASISPLKDTLKHNMDVDSSYVPTADVQDMDNGAPQRTVDVSDSVQKNDLKHKDMTVPMAVDPSYVHTADVTNTENHLNQQNTVQKAMDVSDSLPEDSSSSKDEKVALTGQTQAVSSGLTRVEVTENSTSIAVDESSTNSAYPFYVKTLQEAEEVLHHFENNTQTRFCVWRCPKDFGASNIDLKGKRIYWHEFAIEDRIIVKSNGIPFVMMGRKVYDCHHGKDRNVALKHKNKLKRQENDVKKRNITVPSRKVDCPARIVFCEIIYFPEYKLLTDTKHYRAVIAKTIKQHFTDGIVNLKNVERRIYLSFPSENDHKGHPMGKGSKLSQRVDPKVSNKISQLVAKGILNEKEMKQHLDNYIARELFPGRAKPFHSNRRYYPTKGVIRIKMYNAYIVKRMSMIDLENTEEAVRQWQKVSPDDKFYFRQYNEVNEVLLNGITGISVEEENEDELKIRQKIAKQQVLFAHQTSFQSHLLRRYGNHVCFLDPVYRTVKYALPMFFLTVKTNVDYQIAASFIVQDESKDSTKEALEVLKSWNPDWKPKVFMVDNDAKEIAAVEESFPDCNVLLSDFHREQAWERWLSQPANGVMPHRDAVLLHLRRLAHAMSADQFEKALEELEESDVWRCTYGKTFRNWFEKTWLSLKERWVWSFKVDTLRGVLATNNTIQSQNKEFNHEQLVGQGDTLLSDVLKMLVETVIPAKREAYFEQNAEYFGKSNKYCNLPAFFHGRPYQLADHIAECITSSHEITLDDIVLNSPAGGEFLVRSLESDIEYNVHFGNEEKFPHCECEDWLKTMLPCKHFVAIMRNFKEWNWSKFPQSYRSSPYLTLDETVHPNSAHLKPGEAGAAVNSQNTLLPSDWSQMYEQLLQKSRGKSTASTCRDVLNEINNMTYGIYDKKAITGLFKTLKEALTQLKLSVMDDDLVVAYTEDDPKQAKSEDQKLDQKEHHLTTGRPRKRGKRTNELSSHGTTNADIVNKSAKLDPAAGQASITSTGNEMYEEHVLEEINHMDLLNIDYYRPLNSSAEGGTPVNIDRNTGGIPGPSENVNNSLLFNTSQSSDPQTGSTAYKTLEMSLLNEKKDSEAAHTDSRTASSFSKHEESLALRHEMITHESINLAQSLLREMFPHLKGLQDVARGAVQAFEPVSGDFIQILHDGNLHWVCTSNVSFGVSKDPAAVAMYDSMNQGYVAKFIKQQLASFLCIQSAEMKVVMRSVQQANSVDCGVFAIAFATALAFGEDPSKLRFDVSKMRTHLVECLKAMKMSPFPELKVGAGDIVLSKRKLYTVELFCSCRMPYEKPKSEADLMAQCGGCKEWFHQKCEKIALEIFKASGLNFFCSSCLKKV